VRRPEGLDELQGVQARPYIDRSRTLGLRAPGVTETPVTSPFDSLPRDIFRQMRLANEAAAGLSNWRDQLKALDSSPIQTMMERWRRVSSDIRN